MHPFTKDLRAPLFVLTTCALAVSSVARAAEPTFEEHMAKFKYATVVNAPEKAGIAADQSGLRAYIDPETGALRGPTQQDLDANASAVQSAQSASRSRSVSRAVATGAQNAPLGGTRVMLDDSVMQFSVVTRHADGTLSEICTTGDEHAEHAVKNGIVAASKGELQ